MSQSSNESYTESYVAFLDILGFKSRVRKDGFERIKHLYYLINMISGKDLSDEYSNAEIAFSRANHDSSSDLSDYNYALHLTTIKIMSDSIVIVTPVVCREALAVVIDICNRIQEILYEYSEDFSEPVLVRGAIAKGDMYINEDVMFGQALIDAYLAQEHIAIYPRIILSDSVIASGKCNVDELGGCGFLNLVQDERDCYCYIDTLGNWLLEGNCGIQIYKGDKYKAFRVHVDEMLEDYIDKRVREKYLWLRKDLERAADAAEHARLRHEESIKESW